VELMRIKPALNSAVFDSKAQIGDASRYIEPVASPTLYDSPTLTLGAVGSTTTGTHTYGDLDKFNFTAFNFFTGTTYPMTKA